MSGVPRGYYWGGYAPATIPEPEWDVPAKTLSCECGTSAASWGGVCVDWCPLAGRVWPVPARRWP